MSLPRIVVFTDWFFPGYKAGGPIQSCRNFAQALKNDYEIFIITGDRDLGDQAPYPGIRQNEWNMYERNVHVFYADANSVNAALLQKLIKEIKPGWIYLNSMYSLKFTILPLWLLYKKKTSAKFVLAPRGMLQQGAMQYKSLKKKFFINLLKLSGVMRRVLFQATDAQEESDIKYFFPGAETIVTGNFPKMQQVAWKQAAKQPNQLNMIFVSRIAPKKNLDFLIKLLAQVTPSLQCSLHVWGEAEDSQYLESCKQSAAALPSNIKLQWKGPLSNDIIIDTLQQYHLFVLPTHGENFGHAIFEALLAGKPVLISDKTPWRNLAAKKAGYDISLDQPGAFINALHHFGSMEQSAYNDWSKAAAALATTVQQDEKLLDQYKAIFN